jgi:hypothetical protein
MSSRPSRLLALCGLVLLLGAAPAASTSAQAAPAPAAPDDHGPLLPVRLDAHAALTWESNFGLGGRVDIPLLDTGRLYGATDELSLSVGADVAFVTFGGSDQLFVWPTVTVQWSLGVSENTAVYPELGLAARIREQGWGGMYPNIGFGVRYHLYRSIALHARLGWPIALAGGLTF